MEYVSVRISTLRGDQKTSFNVYLKINEKMVLYIRRGDSFEGERLRKLMSKNLRKVYIQQIEEPSYRQYLQQNIESAYDDKSTKPIQVRAEIIQGIQQNNIEEVFEQPENIENYLVAKDGASKYVQFLLGNSQALKSILEIENIDQNFAHHGVNVAALAVGLSFRLGILDSKSIQHMSLGALLHDYGHNLQTLQTNNPFSHSLANFTPEQKKTYFEHAEKGAAQLRTLKHFDQNVIQIIAQHEEKVDGSGPLGLKESQLDPLALIVCSSNALERLISFEKVPLEEAAKKLMLEAVGAYPLNHIQLLSEILKEVRK